MWVAGIQLEWLAAVSRVFISRKLELGVEWGLNHRLCSMGYVLTAWILLCFLTRHILRHTVILWKAHENGIEGEEVLKSSCSFITKYILHELFKVHGRNCRYQSKQLLETKSEVFMGGYYKQWDQNGLSYPWQVPVKLFYQSIHIGSQSFSVDILGPIIFHGSLFCALNGL